MAESQSNARANEGDAATVAKSIQKNVGSSFLVSTAHVRRGDKVIAIEGGRMLSELEGDDKLKASEVEDLTKHGAIRPASAEDIRGMESRAAAKELAKTTSERDTELAKLDSEHFAERDAVINKHDSAKNAELQKLGTTQEKERADLLKKLDKSSK